MRLSYLARKLEITPRELLLYLQNNKIGNYDSHHSRITEEHQKMVLAHYGSSGKKKHESDRIDETSEVKMGTIDLMQKKSIKASAESTDTQNTLSFDKRVYKTSLENKIQEEFPESEKIQMPKIQLRGIKVVGKIDLPVVEKKSEHKGESEEARSAKLYQDMNPSSEDKRTLEKTDQFHNKRIKRQKGSRRPANENKATPSYIEKLEIEEIKKERKRKGTVKKRKQRKTDHYFKNIPKTIPKVQKQKEPSPSTNEIPAYNPTIYRNPLRKFWAWLNGEYDKP